MSLITRILLLVLIPMSLLASNVQASQKGSYPSVPGEFVVRLKPGFNLNSKSGARLMQSLRSQFKANVSVKEFATSAQFVLVKVPGSAKLAKNTLQVLNAQPEVQYAEPNYLYFTQVMPSNPVSPSNDPLLSQLWGIQNVGQADSSGQAGKAGADINVVPTWATGLTGSKNIKVAVIDTGVDYTHPDLKDNMWINAGEVAGDGIDNDQNGFIDDVYGWNFVDGTTRANDPMDDHYHGTHCAGTIGAMANNGAGVVGVAWNVTMLPIKFLSAQGSGSLAGAVQSIQYATKQKVDVMSNSWGGGPFTQSLYDVIKEATDQGIVFVAAAGNDSSDNDARPSYPATYDLPGIISVGASDNRDQLAGFSNWGRATVDVLAPGVKILSTVPAAHGSYKVLSGTSMATPHVSGMVALMLTQNRSMSPVAVKDRLIQSSNQLRSLSKKSVSKGRVNLGNAIQGITPPPLEVPSESAWKDVAFSAETPHPYADNKTYTFPISAPGAKLIRVVFEFIDTEQGYDVVTLTQANGEPVESVSGSHTNYVSDYLEGDAATLTLRTDSSQTARGFKVAKIQVIE